jgi:hypothetical protein
MPGSRLVSLRHPYRTLAFEAVLKHLLEQTRAMHFATASEPLVEDTPNARSFAALRMTREVAGGIETGRREACRPLNRAFVFSGTPIPGLEPRAERQGALRACVNGRVAQVCFLRMFFDPSSALRFGCPGSRGFRDLGRRQNGHLTNVSEFCQGDHIHCPRAHKGRTTRWRG